jgi:TRAP-type uncharacterized transport system substrate-binding protein
MSTRSRRLGKIADIAGARLRREVRILVAIIALVVISAFALALHFVQPAPPSRIVMSTGRTDGDYYRYGLEYRRLLALDGVDLQLVTSDGALENIGRLMDPNSGVDVAFFQSGTGFAANAPHVESLGTLYYEPLWVFYRGAPITDLRGLNGKRIAIGPEQSGTRPLALQLLSVNLAVMPPTELLPIPGEQAAGMLERGEVDAMLHVAPPDSALVQRLIGIKGVRLLSFDRAEAYVRRFPFLTSVTLPRGVFNLAGNVPDHDIVLLSPTANLLVRDTLHPALAYLLMTAATTIHGEGSLLSPRGQFPALLDAGFPYASEAVRFYKAGEPWLQRYLPYWMAVLVDRLWVLVLPFVALLVPLSRLLPQIYTWRMRSRLYRWYGRLKEIELELEGEPTAEELHAILRRLGEIETAVSHLPMPLAFSENLYSFRTNLDLVRARALKGLEAPQGPGA